MPTLQRTVRTMRSAFRKPLGVVAYRARQELELFQFQFSRGWSRVADHTQRWWTPSRTEQLVECLRNQPVLLASDGSRAVQQLMAERPAGSRSYVEFGDRILARNFSVLNTPVPRGEPFPWDKDWRYEHQWDRRYFRAYDHYEPERHQPYDAKLPWELSRLGFLQPVAQAAILQPDPRWHSFIAATLQDWQARNPLAYSMNWYPMEAAMRGINLVVLLELVLSAPDASRPAVEILVRQLAQHGEFIKRTVEYTDVRGNHYAAEMTALLLIGLALRSQYPKAHQWVEESQRALNREGRLQYGEDGVQFEKSIAYHRLVTELFLLALIACDRNGCPLDRQVRDRIHAAAAYLSACRRPDGLSPNVGDNDDGHVLYLDPLALRDHQPLLDVAAATFQDPHLKSAAAPTAPLAWLHGRSGLSDYANLAMKSEPVAKHFADGGVVIAKNGENFLWMDVGEVGMEGRGGHGHNDLLSFELVLGGRPLIVDPGCSVYTGDPQLRNRFRSTASHNTVQIDGVEMAPLRGMWNIGNDAAPENVDVSTTGSLTTICAAHGGYRRLADPVGHKRTIRFDVAAGTFQCQDAIDCVSRHTVERFFHIAPGVHTQLFSDRLTLETPEGRWHLRWQPGCQAKLTPGQFSQGYGHCEEGDVLVLTDVLEKSATLNIQIDQSTER